MGLAITVTRRTFAAINGVEPIHELVLQTGCRHGVAYLVSPLPTAYEHKHTKTHLQFLLKDDLAAK
jgi:hypothetical protein